MEIQYQHCSNNLEDEVPRDHWSWQHRHRYRQAFANTAWPKPTSARSLNSQSLILRAGCGVHIAAAQGRPGSTPTQQWNKRDENARSNTERPCLAPLATSHAVSIAQRLTDAPAFQAVSRLLPSNAEHSDRLVLTAGSDAQNRPRTADVCCVDAGCSHFPDADRSDHSERRGIVVEWVAPVVVAEIVDVPFELTRLPAADERKHGAAGGNRKGKGHVTAVDDRQIEAGEPRRRHHQDGRRAGMKKLTKQVGGRWRRGCRSQHGGVSVCRIDGAPDSFTPESPDDVDHPRTGGEIRHKDHGFSRARLDMIVRVAKRRARDPFEHAFGERGSSTFLSPPSPDAPPLAYCLACTGTRSCCRTAS